MSLFRYPEGCLKHKSGSFPVFVYPKKSQSRRVPKTQSREDLDFANPEGYPKHQSYGVISSVRKGHYFSDPEGSRNLPHGKPLDPLEPLSQKSLGNANLEGSIFRHSESFPIRQSGTIWKTPNRKNFNYVNTKRSLKHHFGRVPVLVYPEKSPKRQSGIISISSIQKDPRNANLGGSLFCQFGCVIISSIRKGLYVAFI